MGFLGHTVKDKITGFSGVVTGVVSYITGCDQALVVPPVGADGTLVDGSWIDVQRLDISDSVGRITLDNSSSPGFDAAPTRRF